MKSILDALIRRPILRMVSFFFEGYILAIFVVKYYTVLVNFEGNYIKDKIFLWVTCDEKEILFI